MFDKLTKLTKQKFIATYVFYEDVLTTAKKVLILRIHKFFTDEFYVYIINKTINFLFISLLRFFI